MKCSVASAPAWNALDHLVFAIRCQRTLCINSAILSLVSLLGNIMGNFSKPTFTIRVVLAGQPGPPRAAYRLPSMILSVQIQLPFMVIEFYGTYGLVVCIASDELAFTYAHAWSEAYGMQSWRVPNMMIPTPLRIRHGFEFRKHHQKYRPCQSRSSAQDQGPGSTPKAVREQAPMLL